MGNSFCGCKDDMASKDAEIDAIGYTLSRPTAQSHDKPAFQDSRMNNAIPEGIDMGSGVPFFRNVPGTNSAQDKTSRSMKMSQDLIIEPTLLAEFQGIPVVGPVKVAGGGSYEGQILNGQRHGRGIVLFPDQTFYDGTWRNDKKDGYGRCVDARGCIYEGEFSKNCFEGIGSFLNPETGVSYEGRWRNNMQEGFGVETWEDGSVFEGEYSEGLKNGKGIFKWTNGSSYQGEFKGDQIDGYGVYVWADGRQYEGTWRNNQFHGQGTFEYPGKLVYKGGYFMDRKQGYGEMTKSNGEVYKGEWMQGERHGKGILVNRDGSTVEGIWDKGKLVQQTK